MTILSEWISPHAMQALGLAMMHSLWQGALIALLLAGALWALRNKSATMRYWIAMSSLFLMAGLVGATAYYYLQQNNQIAITFPFVDTAATVSDGFNNLTVTETTSLTNYFNTFTAYFRTHSPMIVSVWAMGSLLLLLRLLGSYLFAQRLRAYRNRPAPVYWQAEVERMSSLLGIRKKVWLLESSLIDNPMTIGHWKPVVLLPMGMLTGMPMEQLEAVIAHELAHIRRYDYVFNLMQMAVETIFFYHPVTWWISSIIRDEREHACDDLALAVGGDQIAFARALTNLGEGKFLLPQIAMAWARKKGSLLFRIQRILGNKTKQFHLPEHLVIASLILLSVFSLAFQSPPKPSKLPAVAITSSMVLPAEVSLATDVNMPFSEVIWVQNASDTTKNKNKQKDKVKIKAKAPKPAKADKIKDAITISPNDLPELSTASSIEGISPLAPKVVATGYSILKSRELATVDSPDIHLQIDSIKGLSNIEKVKLKEAYRTMEEGYRLKMAKYREKMRLQEEQMKKIKKELYKSESKMTDKERAKLNKELEKLAEQRVLEEKAIKEQIKKEELHDRLTQEKIRAEGFERKEEERLMREEEQKMREEEQKMREEEQKMREEEQKVREEEQKMREEEQKMREEERRLNANQVGKDIQSMLVADGLLVNENTPLKMRVTNGKSIVNGTKLSQELHQKYLKVLSKHFDHKEGYRNEWTYRKDDVLINVQLD